MSKGSIGAVSLGLVLAIGGGPAWAEVFAYPKQGQTQQQFEFDQYQCHQWAKGQTGLYPTKPQQAAAPQPPQGGAVKGAAGGAALGAIGGAIGGDVGKGAAIGAGVGAAAGLLRQAQRNQQAAQAQRQGAQVQYEKAYAVCLEGRGYQVR